jgi:CRP/FNR family transcriptional regulator
MIRELLLNKMEKEKALAQISYFSSLKKSVLKELAAAFGEKKVKAREVIFREGNHPAFFYLVKQGKVKIYKLSLEGKIALLEVIPAGRSFGEVAVFDGKPYPATAEAMTDATLFYLARQDFLAFLKNYPSVALAIIADLGSRLRFAQELIQNLAIEPAEKRLATAVLKLVEMLGKESIEGVSIDLPLTRLDLAQMTGLTQETTIRIISAWQKEGWVVFKGKRFTLSNLRFLKVLTQDS